MIWSSLSVSTNLAEPGNVVTCLRNYTKAACRAVDGAFHHSSLIKIRTLGVNKNDLLVDVMIGVQKPEEIDTEAVKAKLPVGQVSVSAFKGGLDLPDADTGDT